VWNSVNESEIQNKSLKEREIIPNKFSSLVFDEKLFRKKLKSVKHEDSMSKSKGINLNLPLPDGSIEEFEFFESPCMSKVLSAKYPKIKSYRAISKSNRFNHARVDMGTMGFHAVIYTSSGTVYIDPYFSEPDQNYISYYVRDHEVDASEYNKTCGMEAYMETLFEEKEIKHNQTDRPVLLKTQGVEIQKRKYRLAISTTGEWGQNFGTKENVLSALVTAVSRINMVFENETATCFELIDNNDELIFLDPDTDPFTDASLGGSLIGQNSIVINNIVGIGAYDVGHIFTVSCTDGVAGIAAFGSVCLFNKGNAVSCIGSRNISNFVASTTAHEIGHSFAGGHSWSNCPSSQGQLSSGSAWEPGSGSTILSYGGLCGSQNIVNTRDSYFHGGTIQQFQNFMATTGSCSEESPSGNHAPEISIPAGDGVIIPIATPFELDGIATDEDDDVMTYNWEQMDLGPTSSLGEPTGNAPSFRTYPPDGNTKRLFPRLPSIIGGIGSKFDVLPLYSRDLTFRFNVRDNHPGAGAMVWEEIEFEASESAGPFRVTSPNSLSFVEVGDEMMLEWDVANTDNDIINCQFVDIYLSTDNAKTFDIIIKQNTPNDGSELIEIPNNLTDQGKIKIKASNNIFFQFNRSNIIIREPATPGFYLDFAENNFDVCLPEKVEVDILGTSFQSFDTDVFLELLDVPQGVSYAFSNNPMSPNGQTVLSLEFDDFDITENFEVKLIGIAENADTITQSLNITTTGTTFNDFELNEPQSGIAGVRQIPEFKWSNAKNSEYYTLEIASSPAFGNSLVYTEDFLVDSSFIPQIILDDSQLYYWRIIANNKCISSSSEIRTLGTASLDCKEYSAENLPKNISFSGNITIDAIVRVFDVGELADVNVNLIKGQHSDIFQLSGTLISPSGTEVEMFNRNCFAATDFNVGFDSDSPIDFSCPLNSGLVMKPNVDDLSVLEGEPIDGNWIFRLMDMESGDGGQFTKFDLEICAAFSVDNPYLINNNVLEVPTEFSAKIESGHLLVADDSKGPEDLIYTIVQSTSEGSLKLDGESLAVGDQFTQEQLSSGDLRYYHESGTETMDNFVFTVIDGEGGWLDKTEFSILVDDDIISSNSGILDESNFLIYPNPSSDRIIIQSKDKTDNWNIHLYSIEGKLMHKSNMRDRTSLSVTSMLNGIYVMKIFNENESKSFRIQILH